MASRCCRTLASLSRARPVLRSPAGWTRALSSSSTRMAAAAPEAAAAASPAPPPPPSNPKLDQIVNDISSLTLLQAADLVTLLKTRLNIQEIAMPAAAPSAAPAAAAAEDAPAEEEKPKEKTIFSVKLESIDAAAKAKVIKEIKAMIPNLTLIEAKKFVESLPKVIKENVPKEDADKLKATFESLGGVVKLE